MSNSSVARLVKSLGHMYMYEADPERATRETLRGGLRGFSIPPDVFPCGSASVCASNLV